MFYYYETAVIIEKEFCTEIKGKGPIASHTGETFNNNGNSLLIEEGDILIKNYSQEGSLGELYNYKLLSKKNKTYFTFSSWGSITNSEGEDPFSIYENMEIPETPDDYSYAA